MSPPPSSTFRTPRVRKPTILPKPNSNHAPLFLSDHTLYGSARLRQRQQNKIVNQNYVPPGTHNLVGVTYVQRGWKAYELSNHLGNVLSVISDRKEAGHCNDTLVAFYDPDIIQNNDYYPFGMIQPGRGFNSRDYRFGAFGHESDDEVKGLKAHYTTKDRGYDPRLGRWWSVDPEAGIFPGWTPYRAFLNNPLYFSDKDGSIEWPLKGTRVIQKNNSEYLTNQPVYSKRKGWITQTGDFETSAYTDAYKTYLKNPDINAIIRTSQWNVYRKSTPKQPMTSPHIGTDFRASVGTQVYSLGDGEVTAVDAASGNLTVKYGNGDLVTFRHLNSIGNRLEVGSKVYEGQVIAEAGKRQTTVEHLHIEAVNSEGEQVNFEERNYGTVTNEQFFNEYGGDYTKLPGYKRDHQTAPPPVDSSLEGAPNPNEIR